ncbi:MAG: glycosyltransferase family 4 protein [Chthoniobacter sp.]
MPALSGKSRDTQQSGQIRRHLGITAAPGMGHRAENPYNFLLYRALDTLGRGTVAIQEYRFLARPMAGGVIHLHWPDLNWDQRSAPYAALRGALFLGQCIVWKILGNKLVWTAHNVRSHEHWHPRLAAFFWRILDHLLDGVILLSRTSEAPVLNYHPALMRKPRRVIPHGHYQDVLVDRRTREKARIFLKVSEKGLACVYFGAIRQYKNVEGLLDAFEKMPDKGCWLIVAGKPDTEERRRQLVERAQALPSLVLKLGRLPEEDLQAVVEAADLVVLPYSEVLNSGSILYALSNARPVLVPDTRMFRELAETVSPGWMQFYTGRISPEAICRAMSAVSSGLPPLSLSHFDWNAIAEQHLAFFRELLPETGDPNLSPDTIAPAHSPDYPVGGTSNRD